MPSGGAPLAHAEVASIVASSLPPELELLPVKPELLPLAELPPRTPELLPLALPLLLEGASAPPPPASPSLPVGAMAPPHAASIAHVPNAHRETRIAFSVALEAASCPAPAPPGTTTS